MSHDDVLFGYRLRLFTLAEELQNVSEACRRMGVSRQTYYRLKRQMDRARDARFCAHGRVVGDQIASRQCRRTAQHSLTNRCQELIADVRDAAADQDQAWIEEIDQASQHIAD